MELRVFSNAAFGEVRVTEVDGEAMFCLADVARALEYANPAKAVIDHCKGVTFLETPTNGGVQQIKFGKEAEVYRLIMKSKTKRAEEFQDWVCEEVLPTIRKTGEYRTGRKGLSKQATENRALYELKMSALRINAEMFNMNEASKLALARKAAKECGVADMLPDYVPSRGVHFSATELLQRHGKEISVRAFNKLLAANGLAEVNTRVRHNGKVAHFVTLTSKGQYYGENLVNENNPNQTQPRYYEEKFPILLREIGL